MPSTPVSTVELSTPPTDLSRAPPSSTYTSPFLAPARAQGLVAAKEPISAGGLPLAAYSRTLPALLSPSQRWPSVSTATPQAPLFPAVERRQRKAPAGLKASTVFPLLAT